MAWLSERTAWCFRASKTASSTTPPNTAQVAGRASSRDLGPPDPGQLGYEVFTLLPGVRAGAVLPTDLAFGDPRIQQYEEGTTKETRKVYLNNIVDIA
jgi:hypothetical protein